MPFTCMPGNLDRAGARSEKNLVQLQAFRSTTTLGTNGNRTESHRTEAGAQPCLGKEILWQCKGGYPAHGLQKLRFGTQEVLGYEDMDFPDSIRIPAPVVFTES